MEEAARYENFRTSGVIAASALIGFSLVACGSDDNAAGGGEGGGEATSASDVNCDGKSDLNAAGSTAQAVAFDLFVTAFQDACPEANVNYGGGGSSTGRQQFIDKQIDFAGSDSALKEEEIAEAEAACASPAWNLPLVFGPIAVAYNVDGVDTLILDAPTLAKIFSAVIVNWNDPAIAALNPGVTLPDLPISIIYRGDGSGTTDNFQKYLNAAAPEDWSADRSGSDWKGGAGNGSNGSDGVALSASQTPGSITYVEWSLATGNDLSIAQIDNGGGPVELSVETASAAIDNAVFAEGSAAGGDLTLDLTSIYGTDAAGAYPIILATYEIVCSDYSDDATGTAVKSFLTVAANEGQGGLGDAGYAPLPDEFKAALLESISAIS